MNNLVNETQKGVQILKCVNNQKTLVCIYIARKEDKLGKSLIITGVIFNFIGIIFILMLVAAKLYYKEFFRENIIKLFINHLYRHTTVNDKVGSRYEAGIFGTKKQTCTGNILGNTNSSRGML